MKREVKEGETRKKGQGILRDGMVVVLFNYCFVSCQVVLIFSFKKKKKKRQKLKLIKVEFFFF